MSLIFLSFSNWLNQTATYNNYDAAGRLTDVTQFNGTTVAYGYDNANRLTSLSNNGSNVLANYSFTLDGNGNRTQVLRNEPLTTTMDTGLTSYNYNDKKNRLLSTSTEGSFVYDYDGKLTSGYGTYYSFDNNEHRLLSIGSAYQFVYDGIGNRLRATRNGTVTRYIHDAAGNVLAEADGNNNITKYYIYGQGLLAAVTPANQVYCYHFDANGNTIAMTDASKNIVNKYSYDAFGKITSQVEAIAHPFKYVGQYGVMAEPNGFYYMRARYYDPKVGRFISEDPSGFDGGDVNLYAYVQNNPVNRIDPTGLCGQQTYWENVWKNFNATNTEIPGLLAPIGAGLITAGKTAEVLGTTTVLPWVTSGFSGASLSGASFTAIETGVLVGATAVMNFALTGIAWEAGAFAGSLVSAVPVYGTKQTVGDWWGSYFSGKR